MKFRRNDNSKFNVLSETKSNTIEVQRFHDDDNTKNKVTETTNTGDVTTDNCDQSITFTRNSVNFRDNSVPLIKLDGELLEKVTDVLDQSSLTFFNDLSTDMKDDRFLSKVSDYTGLSYYDSLIGDSDNNDELDVYRSTIPSTTFFSIVSEVLSVSLSELLKKINIGIVDDIVYGIEDQNELIKLPVIDLDRMVILNLEYAIAQIKVCPRDLKIKFIKTLIVKRKSKTKNNMSLEININENKSNNKKYEFPAGFSTEKEFRRYFDMKGVDPYKYLDQFNNNMSSDDIMISVSKDDYQKLTNNKK